MGLTLKIIHLLLHTAIYQVVATCTCLLKVFMCYTQYLRVQTKATTTTKQNKEMAKIHIKKKLFTIKDGLRLRKGL